jgi:hypothetical protein
MCENTNHQEDGVQCCSIYSFATHHITDNTVSPAGQYPCNQAAERPIWALATVTQTSCESNWLFTFQSCWRCFALLSSWDRTVILALHRSAAIGDLHAGWCWGSYGVHRGLGISGRWGDCGQGKFITCLHDPNRLLHFPKRIQGSCWLRSITSHVYAI